MLNKIYIIFVNNVGDLFYATYNPMTKKFDENLEPKFGKVYRQVNKLSKQCSPGLSFKSSFQSPKTIYWSDNDLFKWLFK